VADIDETMVPQLSAADAVAQISRKKALAVERNADDVLIAADTIVVVGGRILASPTPRRKLWICCGCCPDGITR
jgi:septum formation protein